MPKIDQPSAGEIVERELAKFAACFRRSAKGNLWRNYDDLTPAVFRRPGRVTYGWSIAESGNVRYSRDCYEYDAMGSLFCELEGWRFSG
jgi:hypothetical protein